MEAIGTVVLNNGGLRSLVATATLGAIGPGMLYVHDGRPEDAQRYAHFLKQAEHFSAVRRIELGMEYLYAGSGGERKFVAGRWFALLSSAASAAVGVGATKLVWPVQVGDVFEKLASVSEAVVLVEHGIALETGKQLVVETPLLDMNMAQVIGVGQQMQVPWRLARSCEGSEGGACGHCGGCRGRAEWFAKAGVEDAVMARR